MEGNPDLQGVPDLPELVHGFREGARRGYHGIDNLEVFFLEVFLSTTAALHQSPPLHTNSLRIVAKTCLQQVKPFCTTCGFVDI